MQTEWKNFSPPLQAQPLSPKPPRDAATFQQRCTTSADLRSLFLARKQFLDTLQPLDRFCSHPVLHEDFRLQHQVLQGSRTESRLVIVLRGFRRRLADGRKTGGDDAEPLLIDLTPQQFEPFVVSGFVRVDFCRAIQAFARFVIVGQAGVQVKQFSRVCE